MAVSSRTKLGPYEIVGLIGKGGMGEVYRARDTRLDRTVALKLLNTSHAERFEREARAISSLNHPNICALYDVGSENGDQLSGHGVRRRQAAQRASARSESARVLNTTC